MKFMEPADPNPEQYESVKKLLALKRHEEPPPGYFDRLPGAVRARIAHAAAHPEPFWRRWLAAWDLSPALATSYAGAAVAVLIGVVWFTRPSGANNSAGGVNPQVATTPVEAVKTNVNVASNTAPPGLFSPPSLPVQPAGFQK